MRALRYEGLDPMESGIFELQVDEAERETRDIPIPTLKGKGAEMEHTLNELLSGRGLTNARVRIDVQPTDGDHDDIQVDMHLHQRREQDLRNALQFDEA
jgi:hypothetical protein